MTNKNDILKKQHSRPTFGRKLLKKATPGEKPGRFPWRYMKKKQGFTILEVIVAILVITVAFVGLAAITTTVINGNFFNKTLSQATTLAKDKMEELKTTPFASLPSTTVTDYATAQSMIQDSASGAYYTRTCEATGTASLKTITVRVVWPPGRSVELKTLRARD